MPVRKHKKTKRKVAKTAKRKVIEKPQPEKDTLTPKQIRFVQEYLIDFNATQAAIRAGYSKKTARQQGNRMLTNVDIQKKLRELLKQQEARTQIDADKVIQEAARIALADVGPAFNRNGTLKDIHDMPEDIRRVISGVEVVEEFTGTGKNRKLTGYLKRVKFWSKDKQVEILMRHLGLFLKDNQQTGQSFATAIHAAYEAMKDKTSG